MNAWCNQQDYTFFTTAGMSLTPRELPLFLLAGDIMSQDPLSSTRSRILMLWRSCFYANELSDFTLPLTPSLRSSSSSLSPPAGPFLFSHLISLISFLCHSDADENGQHGTEDFARGSKPIFDARRLKVLVDNDPTRTDVPAPRFNAESYAGAATELWAQNFCQKKFIPPQNGYQT